MPNIQDSGGGCENFSVTESKVWRILPDFIRKKSGGNKKRQQPEDLKLTDVPAVSDTKNDDEENAVTGEVVRDLGKKSLSCRKSWTYGYCSVCDRGLKQCIEEGKNCDNNGQNVGENVDYVRKVKELQREHSFPGHSSGSLTKNEAKRRLMSWKKTTIARKNSEKQ